MANFFNFVLLFYIKKKNYFPNLSFQLTENLKKKKKANNWLKKFFQKFKKVNIFIHGSYLIKLMIKFPSSRLIYVFRIEKTYKHK